MSDQASSNNGHKDNMNSTLLTISHLIESLPLHHKKLETILMATNVAIMTDTVDELFTAMRPYLVKAIIIANRLEDEHVRHLQEATDANKD